MLGNTVHDSTTNFPLINANGNCFDSASTTHSYAKMEDIRGPPGRHKSMSMLLVSSYAFDWVVLLVVAGIGGWLGILPPNHRPFQLENHNISFPFTEKETVPMVLAAILNTGLPIIIVSFIALVFVPGSTVPPGTPKSMIWRRKLWELHTGLLGLALSVVGAWFVTNAMKNMFGKPRPDLISRCQPDLENVAKYVVGGIANTTSNGQLVSHLICKNPDSAQLEDGFRSFPSGHSSSSSAGLLYLSLFIASKFAITIPFLAPSNFSNASSFSAFPSRIQRSGAGSESYEMVDRSNGGSPSDDISRPNDPAAARRLASHSRAVAAVRLQAAAPPLYLLLIACLPTFGAIFISGSRWFDYRHHAFDIITGFLIGVITAVFAFRYYHLPISQGAGWAWGPRSQDKAYWAGVGSYSYATSKNDWSRAGEEDEASVEATAQATDYESVRRQHIGVASSGHNGPVKRAYDNASIHSARPSPPNANQFDFTNRV
ncbi:hypothetical protein MCOR27_007125 [Pyricularia oryzae]|uniref:Phosphatidic acid phosphatase type 2/haloperoxidase domain-containing protein n=5 Tax=Pyricularia TaxID=48558 RepID=A0ABQ8N927_PYRGI|nr:PAP2 domain-containing protein [Pyricularia oryzae 70-15]KAH8845229.1 hypothetical protein MCOR01_002475 [Pyricularia oryzae]KAI6293271.1 hypothetical protein MCOR33_009273 [Pyricularia grisea]EHA57931.1 PAP2 domain-containing protein [Pyricularia oryzae 70-15]KAH9428919.1 hypothetical protein MCOR02_010339 [Pyricularia oryzae]KAI6256749.1 hypothetical protein MCOR19_006806 [Pyricularia oryzae]